MGSTTTYLLAPGRPIAEAEELATDHAMVRIRSYHERFPPADDFSAQRERSVSLDQQGDILRAQGKLEEALAAYRAGLAIRERLAVQDPSNAQWQRDVVAYFSRLAVVALAQKRNEEARVYLERGLAICRQLRALSPTNAQYASDVTWFENQLARLSADPAP